MEIITAKSDGPATAEVRGARPVGLAADEQQHQRIDLDTLMAYLGQNSPMLTQSGQVRAFEKEWSEWLGVKHSVFVNSGASANLLTITALRETFGLGEIIVPTPHLGIGYSHRVIQCGFTPVFVYINPRTLGMDEKRGPFAS